MSCTFYLAFRINIRMLLSNIVHKFHGYRNISLISLSALFFTLGNGVVWFVLPIIAEKLVDNLIVFGVLMALPFFIQFLFDIPLGMISDYLGRKKLIITGLFFMFLLGIYLPYTSSIIPYVIFMIILGVAGLIIVVPARSYVMRISPANKSSEFFGIFETLYQLGFTIGPVIAGYLLLVGLNQGVSYSGLFYSFVCLISIAFLLFLPDIVVGTHSIRHIITSFIHHDKIYLRGILDYRDLNYAGLTVLLSTFVFVTIDGITWAIEPLYTTEGYSTEFVGLLLSVFVIPFLLFELPAGIIADRFGKTKVLFGGMLMGGIFFILFGLVDSKPLLLTSAFLSSTGLALSKPAIDGFLTDISSKKERGGIVGVWNMTEDLAYVISPIIGGIIAEYYGLQLTFIFCGGLLIVSIPVLVFLLRKAHI